jgi:hypothetical protein
LFARWLGKASYEASSCVAGYHWLAHNYKPASTSTTGTHEILSECSS